MNATPDDLSGLAAALGPLVRTDQPLGSLTTYRLGGPAALFCAVDDELELAAVARAFGPWSQQVPVLVLGRGSNLLIADRGFYGLAVSLGPGFEALDITGPEVRAGAALSLPVLARRTAAAGLRGLEWAVGVPGSVGGAIRMNAGGHGSDTAATLVSFRWVDLVTSEIKESPAEVLRFGYRHSGLTATDVVVSGVHRLVHGSAEEATGEIAGIVRWRRANQPGGSNAGSVFTNPPDDSAGRLIESCGLKGHRLGTAQVSTKHANFIQADPGGSADDVAALIAQVRTVVARQTGVELSTEVRLIGFDDDPGGR